MFDSTLTNTAQNRIFQTSNIVAKTNCYVHCTVFAKLCITVNREPKSIRFRREIFWRKKTRDPASAIFLQFQCFSNSVLFITVLYERYLCAKFDYTALILYSIGLIRYRSLPCMRHNTHSGFTYILLFTFTKINNVKRNS